MLRSHLATFVRSVHKSIKSKVDYSRFPAAPVAGKDFEEKLVKGSGPGGQAVNKTANAVQLRHLETGITVKCHETRSVERNRKLAVEKLRHALDLKLNGDFAVQRQIARLQKELEEFKKEDRAKKREAKRLAKLGIDPASDAEKTISENSSEEPSEPKDVK